MTLFADIVSIIKGLLWGVAFGLMLILGTVIVFGVIVPIIVDWFKERFDPETLYNRGMCYYTGKGVDKDYAISFDLFLKAARRGHVLAQYWVAYSYEHSLGVKESLPDAFKWYLEAANNGDSDAQLAVAWMYQEGRGVEKNEQAAVKILEAGAIRGLSEFQLGLGWMYEMGYGVELDYFEAIKWYRKAAEQGNNVAMRNIGVLYEDGDGLPKNLHKALMWYDKAVANGLAKAKKDIERVRKLLNEDDRQDDDIEDEDMHDDEDDESYDEDGQDGGEDDNCVEDDDVEYCENDENSKEDCADEKQDLDGDNDEADPIEDLNGLIGLESVKREVLELKGFMEIQAIRRKHGLKGGKISCHCVFTGNPGTGKTTVARIIARIYHKIGVIKTDKLVETDRSGLVAEYTGQTAVKTNSVVDSALDGVLFIDEAYTLAEGGKEDFGKEAIATLLKRMEDDRGRLVVIVAGYKEHMRHFMDMNPGLASRFAKTIEFPDYNEGELVQIFLKMVNEEDYVLTNDAKDVVCQYMRRLIKNKDRNFANARTVRNFYDETIRNLARRLLNLKGKKTKRLLSTIVIEDLPVVNLGSTDEVEKVLAEINSMIGLASVKEELRRLVAFVRAQKAREERGSDSITMSYHCVFTGNPGTGKTTIARAIAKIYHALGILASNKLIESDRSRLVAEYVGQTAGKTNDVIDSALDGVLFIDEAYTLVEGGEGDFGKEAIATLLKRMEDDRNRLVVIVAGYGDEMQQFLASNPGLQSRFTRTIEFPDYSAQELTQIFISLTGRHRFMLSKNVEAKFMSLMKMAVAKKDKHFGNGRFVRNCFEKIVEQQAIRLSKIKSPSASQILELKVEDVAMALDRTDSSK